MTPARLAELQALEGREVTLALAEGRRIDAAALVSAARGDTVWCYVGGADEFVPVAEIVDFFEAK